ncbi:MAG: hypothetical protein ACFCGT_26615 [Sandaracinaceae bacterium]
MKHLSIMIALLAMGLSVVACGGNDEGATEETTTAESPPSEEVEAAEEAAAEAEEPAEEAMAEAEEPAEEPGAEAEEPSAEGEAGAEGGACGQAVACCEAYIEVMGATTGVTAEQACAGVRQASTMGEQGAAACNAAVQGWRQALTAAQHDIPGACTGG